MELELRQGSTPVPSHPPELQDLLCHHFQAVCSYTFISGQHVTMASVDNMTENAELTQVVSVTTVTAQTSRHTLVWL